MCPHNMRRADREITDAEHIESILTRGRYASFALVDRDMPYVVTLSYGYDAEARRLYCHVAHEGRKLDIIERSPRACATIIIDAGYNSGECEHPFESVVMDGALRKVVDDAEKRHAIHTLVGHLEDDPDGYWESRKWSLDERIDGFSALAFEIGTISAKQGS